MTKVKRNVMTWQRRAAATVLVGLVGLVVAGCGGGNDDNGNADKQLSHTALVARANSLCRAATSGVTKVPPASSLEALADYASDVATISGRLHADLARLTPPARDRVTYNRYLEALATSNEQLSAMQRAAQDGDDGGVRTAVSKIVGADVGLAAANAGFGLCAAATPVS
ncbi:hypothetical protein [Conexibacter sp. CPCC 206217]|uniref:hypothetical protein n=1 Tax=Conexibacter sp. CPCC 206217 TaxID=3064574 RepID=UPI00271B2D22|nr:hypothetical protein [Conexibacter sp. CPCC 206217]MDO8210587.1 hypothetical protein [Conexibacter sp. CPCC 206217]